MNDPCNLSAAQQALFVPASASRRRARRATGSTRRRSRPTGTTSTRVVDYIRALRRVDKVSLIGWSLGGPRAGGYAAQHPDKVHKLVLLAPGVLAERVGDAARRPCRRTARRSTRSRAPEFDANWDRQLGCPNQFDLAARESVWSNMIASDPVAATWGPGVRRAPNTTTWGWNEAMAAQVKSPTLLVAGAHDAQVAPAGVARLHADLGASQKLLRRSRRARRTTRSGSAIISLLFQASREWLEASAVNGVRSGTVKLGY